MNHWLVKQEPGTYSWETFARDKQTDWTGVRNFQARNFLRQMRKGDRVLFYHSGGEKRIVGTARVVGSAYPDPTAQEGDWVAVDLKADKPLPTPVSLSQIKDDPLLKEMLLVRQSRLSVMLVTAEQYARILDLSKHRITH